MVIKLFVKTGGKYEAAGRDTGTTILVHNTGNTSILPVSSSICNTGTDTGKY
jgi:hypothetical protein